MLVSHALTIGQITFILRVAIQMLSYGGLFLLGLILLGTAPRIASIGTHDIFNRIAGKSTSTSASAKWIFNTLRGKSGEPVVSIRLLMAVSLLVLYSLFVSVSDVGFIGFYACSTSGPPSVDYPASLITDDLANAAVISNLVNGTDPATVKAYRCDSINVISFGVNVTERNCTAWHNSTYADPALFRGVNMTDSDVLMPRQLKHVNQSRSAYVDLNSFYMGPGSQRIAQPTIKNGIAVFPHDTGVKAVVGVPQLAPQHKVVLDKTLAVEVDVGCMTLGVYSIHDPDSIGSGVDVFDTNGTWREYTGPDYLRDVLSKTVDVVRKYYTPFFNASTLGSDGIMNGLNASQTILSGVAIMQSYYPPGNTLSDGVDAKIAMIGNCTQELRQQLNLTVLDNMDAANMCSLLGIAGSTTSEGNLIEGFSRMVCASATQINMVTATVEADVNGTISLDLTRLPSDLNYLRADYWDAMEVGNDTQFTNFLPLERFTLADNPQSSSSHFITHYQNYSPIRPSGPGSGGNTLSRVGPTMINADG